MFHLYRPVLVIRSTKLCNISQTRKEIKPEGQHTYEETFLSIRQSNVKCLNMTDISAVCLQNEHLPAGQTPPICLWANKAKELLLRRLWQRRRNISELFFLRQQGFRVEDYDGISTITLFSLIPACEALTSIRENSVPGKGYPNTIRH